MTHALPTLREQRRRTVLVVDDEEANRQLMSALLSALGLRVLTARDGPSALAVLAAGGIDLVLLDVMMPGMDGMEVCRRVREELGLTELFIVFVTALSDRDSRMRAKAAGANDFLVKPVDSFELHFRAAQWLKLGLLLDLSADAERLEAGLTALADATRNVAAPLAQASASGSQDVRELTHVVARAAEQLAQISTDAARLAAECRESRIALHKAPATTSVTVPAAPRNQPS